MNRKISDKDKKDWKKFVTSKEKLVDKDSKLLEKKITSNKILDLHGFSLDEANLKIKKFIEESYNLGIEKLIIVTGKGLHSQNESDPYVSKKLGILRYSIPEYLNNNKDLLNLIKNISPAKIDDGGDGAFYVYLRKKK